MSEEKTETPAVLPSGEDIDKKDQCPRCAEWEDEFHRVEKQLAICKQQYAESCEHNFEISVAIKLATDALESYMTDRNRMLEVLADNYYGGGKVPSLVRVETELFDMKHTSYDKCKLALDAVKEAMGPAASRSNDVQNNEANDERSNRIRKTSTDY